MSGRRCMTYRLKEPGRGSKDKRQPGVTQLVIRLDDETFAQVRDRAVRAGTSVAEQMRLLIEWGLETAASEDAA